MAAFGLLAVVLPRLVNTPEFREALARRAGEALGTPVEWKNLEIGFLPPRVILDEPVLVAQDTSDAADASLRVGSIDLRLAWLPLLERRIAIESLVLRGLDLVVTRTPDGIVLPEILRMGAGSSDEGAPGEAAGAPPAEAPEAFVLDLRALRLEQARVVIHDRTFDPAVDARLEGISLVARGRSLGEPLEIEGAARVYSNDRELGGAKASGKLALEGGYALEFELDRILVAELRRFLSDLDLREGALSGTVFVAGQGSEIERLTTDVEIAGLGLRVREIDLRGDLGLRARQKDSGPITFGASWKSAEGGTAEITGERDPAGDVEGTAMLAALELAPFAPLLGEDLKLGGRASGEVSLALVSGRIARVESELAITAARYADERIDTTGQLDLALGLEGLEPNDALRVQAVFAPTSGGRLDVNATGTVDGALRSALRFDAFDVSIFTPLLPEGIVLAGKLTGDLELVTTAEREIAELLAKLRVGGARLVQGDAKVAGDLSLDARSQDAGPVAFVARATLESGGRVDLEGRVARSGALDLQARLDALDLSPVARLLASPDLSVAGHASGRVTLAGPPSDLEALALDLTLADAVVGSGEARIEGPLTLRLELAKPQSLARRGTLVLDLSQARATQGETFVKPAGVRLFATTEFAGAESGRTGFKSRIALHNIRELFVQGSIGEKTVLVLTSPAFDLKGWSALLPALADYAPDGEMAFERFSLERSDGEPDRFGGRIALRSVDLQLPGAGRVRVRGNADGAGERIDLSGISATLHGLTVGIDGHVAHPLAAARFELAAHSIGEAEANDLVSGLASVRDTVYGALRFDARLSGSGSGEAPMLETLAGNVRFTVGESGGGRLRGVSLLSTTLSQIPLLGGAARIAERLRGQPGVADDLGTNLGERFELLEGDLAIADGAIDARTLRIRYRGHEARLMGRLRLDGLELDMKGELLLDSPLVAALAGRPASEFANRAPIRIPLARVTNTLAKPKVTLSPETLAAAPQLLFLTTGVGQVVDQAIGRVGGAVDRAIGDLGRIGGGLGGKTGSGKAGEGSGPGAGGARNDVPAIPDAGTSARPDSAQPMPSAEPEPAPRSPSAEEVREQAAEASGAAEERSASDAPAEPAPPADSVTRDAEAPHAVDEGGAVEGRP